MSSPTFPLVTLAPTVGPAGIQSWTYQQIFQSLQASFKSIYGSDALLTPDTQDGQFLAVMAQAFYDLGQQIVAVYNSYAPAYAQGAGLSAQVKINGIQRLVPGNSTATVTVVGVAATVIFGGVAQDQNGNLWNLPPSVTIPGGGSIDVTATCQVLGAIVAIASTINQIFTPTKGWQTVNNAADAVPGAPIESDAALRQRQALSVGLPAQSPLGAIVAAIANIPGIGRNTIYENQGASTDSNGVPSHSIVVIVENNINSTLIGQTIQTKKSPGTGTFGSSSILVNDQSGIPITINYTVGAHVNIYVTVTIKALAGYSQNTNTSIINTIVNFINTLSPGAQVYYNWLLGVASLLGSSVGTTFRITAMTTGTAPSPTGTADIGVAYNQMAFTAVANIIVNVT